MKETIKKIRDLLYEGDLEGAFDLCDYLEWGDSRSAYKKINCDFIDLPAGTSRDDIRQRLKRLTATAFPDAIGMKDMASSAKIAEYLLKKDFHPQKEYLLKAKLKPNIILLQGSPHCGLKYFVLGKHENCSLCYLKANQLNRTEDETEFWVQVAMWFDLSEETKKNIKNPDLDPPTLIFSELNSRSKEKPIVLVVYEVEVWKDNCLNNLTWFADKLSKISLFKKKDGAYCYFIHTDIQRPESCYCDGDNLIALPHVSELEDTDMKDLYLNYESYFTGSSEDVKSLFSEKKKLVDVINMFVRYSSCGAEIDRHIHNKLPI